MLLVFILTTSESAPSLIASSDGDNAANLFISDMLLSGAPPSQMTPGQGEVGEGRRTDESSGDTDTTIDDQLLQIKNVPQMLWQTLPIGAPRFEIDAQTRKRRRRKAQTPPPRWRPCDGNELSDFGLVVRSPLSKLAIGVHS